MQFKTYCYNGLKLVIILIGIEFFLLKLMMIFNAFRFCIYFDYVLCLFYTYKVQFQLIIVFVYTENIWQNALLCDIYKHFWATSYVLRKIWNLNIVHVYDV